MDRTREILRQKLELTRTHREVAASVGVSLGVVSKTVTRARAAGLDWAQIVTLDDESLRLAIFGPILPGRQDRPLPDCLWIHVELSRPAVTLELLHQEYLAEFPDGYGYTQFCEYYRRWRKGLKLSMRQVHRAGERLFVDYSGVKLHYFDRESGERVEAEFFVAAMGASNYTFAEATRTQRGPDFVMSHVRALEYLEGSPEAIVCDQLRSGVSRPCRYDPEIQRTYEEMARHYGCTVLPARPRKPKDKAKVEAAVQVAQRWILARLRNQKFFSLDELNDAVAELLEDLNNRPMKSYGGKSRQQLFDEVDRPALRPLPTDRFVYSEWSVAGANIDYHVEVDRHYYSVPHALRGERLDVRLTARTVEVFFKRTRVASHVRSYKPYQHTTVPEHMPKAHRDQMEWSPSRLVRWAESIGPQTAKLIQTILEERPHPEQGYRTCLGILRLAKRHSSERLEAACARGVRCGARSYRSIDTILKKGLDRLEVTEKPNDRARPRIVHENVRGPAYYN